MKKLFPAIISTIFAAGLLFGMLSSSAFASVDAADTLGAGEVKTADDVAEALQMKTAAYKNSKTATSNGVTFTVQWNEPVAGQDTTFHVNVSGGSNVAKARMDVPTYYDSDGSGAESVCDPTRNNWGSYYTLGSDGHDFTFNFTASGRYYMLFYYMDTSNNVYYLRSNFFIAIDDASHPAVSTIVANAVAQARQITNGSDYDMALWLHDWELKQLNYDYSLNYCSAESGLTRGKGTCESFQRIYQKLLTKAGLENARMEGNGHTWNAVKIDGKWCQVDVNWDDDDGTKTASYGFDATHLYFGLTDELMTVAHSDHAATYQASGYAYRSTDLSNNYFVRSGQANTWAATYAKRIQAQLDAKAETFSMPSDNASLPPSICGIQNGIVAYAISQQKWNAADGDKAILSATSNVQTISNTSWTAAYDFAATYRKVLTANRLFGDTRYDTMAKISAAGFASSDNVVLASGANFPDALGASALAGALSSPVLLTEPDTLSEQAAAEIERLEAKNVYIIGGEMSVSSEIERALIAKGYKVERIFGSARQQTAAEIAKKVASLTSPDTAIVASGAFAPDSTSVSPFAYAKKYPIYLAESDNSLSKETLGAIKANASVKRIVIVGGHAVVSTETEAALTSAGYNVERWYGETRYDTSRKIAEHVIAEGLSVSTVAVASGENFPDALAGGALVGSCGGVLLLSPGSDGSEAASWVESHAEQIERCYLFGGALALSAAVEHQVNAALAG